MQRAQLLPWATLAIALVGMCGCIEKTPIQGGAAPPAGPAAAPGPPLAAGVTGDDADPDSADPAGVPEPGPSGFEFTIWNARQSAGELLVEYRRDSSDAPRFGDYRLMIETSRGEKLYADLGSSFGRGVFDAGGSSTLRLNTRFLIGVGGLGGSKIVIAKAAPGRPRDDEGQAASNVITLESAGPASGSVAGSANSSAPPDPALAPPADLPFDAHGAWHTLRQEFGKPKVAIIRLNGWEKLDIAEDVHERVEELKKKHADLRAVEVITKDSASILLAPCTDAVEISKELGLGQLSGSDTSQGIVFITLDSSLFKPNDSGIVEDESHPEFFAKNLELWKSGVKGRPQLSTNIHSNGALLDEGRRAAVLRLAKADPGKCTDSAQRSAIAGHFGDLFDAIDDISHDEIQEAAIEGLVKWDRDSAGEKLDSRLSDLAGKRFFAKEEEAMTLIEALGELQEASAAETLARIIASTAEFGGPDRKFIEPAAEAMAKIGAPSEEWARKLVQHNDPQLCLTGIEILSAAGTAKSLEILREASTKSPNREVREAAKEAIREIRQRGSSS